MLKAGMYVRCPVDNEAESIDEARRFFLGQIESFDESAGQFLVKFHDPLNLRLFFTNLPDRRSYSEKQVYRTTALENCRVIFKGRTVKLLCVSKKDDKEAHYNYFVEYIKDGKAKVGEVSEKQIEIPFTKADYNPVYQMLRYELHNPSWYICRRIVSKSLNAIANSPFGFKNLLGTRVHLFTHQVDTVIRALSENPCRLMLADEVGLGKTIEALAIIKGLIDKRPNFKSLIIVPDTLIYQWQTEIDFKFWKEATIWGADKISNPQILLVSLKDLVKDHVKILRLCRWDICVVDEAHKLLRNKELYDVVLAICKSTENVLLLSATPILRREQEYGKLLTLLNPVRFENMESDVFAALFSKQKNIQDIVFNLMQDLPDYVKYELYDDFIQGLEQINEEIKDFTLTLLIKSIDRDAEDLGLSQIKLSLAYIAEFYQIERGIIRHRRAETEAADIKRGLIDISYEMAGSDVGFYEENTYNAVLDLADELCAKGNSLELVKSLISAVLSSPYALLSLINENKRYLEKYEIDSLVMLTENWCKAFDNEIVRIQQVTDDIDSFFGKFAKIVDYIDQEDTKRDKKYLIFTGFTATAKKLEECFIRFFGKNSTCSFHSDKTAEEMQKAATLFQDEDSYRFMICDESGGEGRNFQMADYIVHCDLTFSPAMLEQRIGRLDRIGRQRDKDVTSIVVYSKDTLENNLFDIYNKGLNIFTQSLCGMEIVFEQIQDSMENALKSDIRFGLADVIPEITKFANMMKKEIEKERYYDLARQLDLDLRDKLNKLIAHFTDNEGEVLMETMLAWPSIAGFKGIAVTNAFNDGYKIVSIDTTELSVRSMENALYFPPKMEDIIRRSKYNDDIRGTFSRNAAIRHENLTFFAPYNAFFDSITTNAEESYKGRCVSMKYVGCEIAWAGLVQTWNVRYNPVMLYRKGFSPQLMTLISRYLPGEQIIYTNGIKSGYEEISSMRVIDQIEAFEFEKPIHLGKRDNGAIDIFKKQFPKEKWREYVKLCYNKGKRHVCEQIKELIEIDVARKELERILNVNKARELFYGFMDENTLLKTTDEIEALVYGLENPIIELDSIAFVVCDNK